MATNTVSRTDNPTKVAGRSRAAPAVLDRGGLRLVALMGGVIYAVGVVLASFSHSRSELWLLVLGYGVISGFGA